MQGEIPMAKDQTRRLTFVVLSADRKAFAALQAVDDYAPSNQAYTTEAIKAARDRMDDSQREAIQAERAAAAKRDIATASEWEFHNAILGAKTQVTAQFGPDSNELAALGLKKKSEYKSPTRRKQSTQPSD
jgi:chemotaxis regulatin CheY-phosphate phosphatase CheZ